jgi:hypothetical protein
VVPQQVEVMTKTTDLLLLGNEAGSQSLSSLNSPGYQTENRKTD